MKKAHPKVGKPLVRALIGAGVVLLLATLMLVRFQPLEGLEEKLLDYRFKLRGKLAPPEDVVIAAIDEKSLLSLGRFPWSRDKLARIIDNLSQNEAEIIMVDIILSETEKNDKALAAAIRRAGNVILPVSFDFERKTGAPLDELYLPSAYFVENPGALLQYPPVSAGEALVPVPVVAREAMGFGHVNVFPDNDGTIRQNTAAIEYKGYLYPSIDIHTAAAYLGVPPEGFALKWTRAVMLGKRQIPVDGFGRALIHYYGPQYTFKHISLADVYDGTVEPELVQGRVVLIGATAMGLYDLRVTPFSPTLPGIEMHANFIASILDGRFLKRVSGGTDLVVLFAAGGLFLLLISSRKATGAAIVTALALSAVLGAGYLLFVRQGLWLNVTYPVAAVFLIFIGISAYNYAAEERFARRIKAMFSSYVTERVVDELIRNPEMAKLGGERREVTVLFSDVSGFTSFSEKHPPEEVVAILNEYLAAMTEVIFRWEGTLDKFIGDAILTFWNAPMKQDNHAELAVRCALNMVDRLAELQRKWLDEGKDTFDMGIGINTGEVLVGNIGADGKKMDYTVIGDHVNLGSRVESLTRKYKTHILITEFTFEKVRDSIASNSIGHVRTRGIEKVIVKGKEKPVALYEMVSIEPGLESVIVEMTEGKTVRFETK